MGIPRYRAQADINHSDIVKILQRVGCSVLDLSHVGGGCPDLLVARNNRNVLIEVKRPKAKGQREGTLTPQQKEFMCKWRGPVHVVQTEEEALRAVGISA